ncbi:MAG: Uma2 family endonuclease [Polyangiaceae bacterium]|jgi:Uma2 family endonuclease|nr:Uma2 family endonuclease [Polyangiaceae bacterium]
MTQPLPYAIDPDDPRAPTEEQWARMADDERARVVAMLPADVPFELFMPEGDQHRKAKSRAVDALDSFFKRIGRRVYVSSELAVYYPGQPRFAPDVLAVLDVEPHERDKWVVAHESKGLDFVLEIHVSGDVKKDYESNRKRYALLGIPEYFLFDRTIGRLYGWRLPSQGARVYETIVPQKGLWASKVLSLDIAMEVDRLRFYYGGAAVPESEDLIERLESMVNGLVDRREQAERERQTERKERERAEQERELAEQERERAEQERQAERTERERAEQERDRAVRQRDAAHQRIAALEAELAKRT